jgi:hypothetical protein
MGTSLRSELGAVLVSATKIPRMEGGGGVGINYAVAEVVARSSESECFLVDFNIEEIGSRRPRRAIFRGLRNRYECSWVSAPHESIGSPVHWKTRRLRQRTTIGPVQAGPAHVVEHELIGIGVTSPVGDDDLAV